MPRYCKIFCLEKPPVAFTTVFLCTYKLIYVTMKKLLFATSIISLLMGCDGAEKQLQSKVDALQVELQTYQ